eukprot:TRINITY_DN40096_c0_g1_i1.p1 TRINITY_DN40096_c0_g1~~TRINITY_DN40096_c0_g1_i1.p1  ORF type:complete len:381 (-),score=67.02 TRINITY_DN40096_c0_g1_i1:104-1246(-)
MQARQRSDRRASQQGTTPSAEVVSLGAQERAAPVTAGISPRISEAPSAHPPVADMFSSDTDRDMDVTVLAFAQWASEMKNRQANSHKQMQTELNTVKNAINCNHLDLTDFKRHGAAIQQQMQLEINEIRESLSSVFMEITAAVRNNASADQELKLKIQSLNEQAVRNETAFAQLADAADQSQSKLRAAVLDMQQSSERMRDDLSALNQQTESLQGIVGEQSERLSSDMDQVAQELRWQLEKRKDKLKRLVTDVVSIGEHLQTLMRDIAEHQKDANTKQSKIQSSLYAIDRSVREEAAQATPTPTITHTQQGSHTSAPQSSQLHRQQVPGAAMVREPVTIPSAPLSAGGQVVMQPYPTTSQISAAQPYPVLSAGSGNVIYR